MLQADNSLWVGAQPDLSKLPPPTADKLIQTRKTLLASLEKAAQETSNKANQVVTISLVALSHNDQRHMVAVQMPELREASIEFLKGFTGKKIRPLVAEKQKKNNDPLPLLYTLVSKINNLEVRITCSMEEARIAKDSLSSLIPSLNYGNLPEKIKQAKAKTYQDEFNQIVNPKSPKAPLVSGKGHDYNRMTVNGKTYLASAAPFNPALFWEVVQKENVHVIVKLVDQLFTPYFPNQDQKMQFKGLAVEWSSEEKIASNLVVRQLILHSQEKGRIIKQIDFTGWPDFGVPALDAFKALLKTVQEQYKGKSGPLLVHCLGGIGRTGTFIAAHSNLDNPSIDFVETVLSMRRQRPKHMVERPEQYALLYEIATNGTRQ